MLPIPLIFWALLAAAAALYSGQTHAQALRVGDIIQRGSTVAAGDYTRSGTGIGLQLSRVLSQPYRTASGLNLTAVANDLLVPGKANLGRALATACRLTPVGIAATVGAAAVLSMLADDGLSYQNATGYGANVNTVIWTSGSIDYPRAASCSDSCAASVAGAAGSTAGCGTVTVGGTAWRSCTCYQVATGLAHSTTCGRSAKNIAGSFLATHTPASQAALEAAFANEPNDDAGWAAGADALISLNYPFPLDGTENASYVSPAFESAPSSASTTTLPDGSTQTATTKTRVEPAVAGNAGAAATNKVTFNEKVIKNTVTTGPAGTTEEETIEEVDPESNLATNPGDVTVNVEFPEPEFTDTALPEVPVLYEQKYPNGLAGVWAEKGPQLMATTFITSVQGMFPTLSGSGSCPVWQINLNFGAMGNFGTGDISPPCWIWGAVALIFLTSACFTAWRIIFG